MTITLLVVSLLAQAAAHSHDQAVKDRGAHVMGFDQDATVHHFRLHPDGGSIDIAVKNAGDTANRDAIRGHLPHITQMFSDGNFEAPLLIHGTDVPGSAVMAARKNQLRFV